jgi:predicted nucleotidyltransferase
MQYGTYITQARKRKKARRETQRRTMLDNVWLVLERLIDHVAFDEAIVFGSVTKPGMFTDRSDIDVGFWNLKNEQYFFTMAFLSRELDRDVDVIQLETAADRLRTKILQEGIRWTPNT